MNCMSLGLLAVFLAAASDSPPIDPVPRPFVARPLARWDFDAGTDGWAAEHECTLTAEGGLLKSVSSGRDPYFHTAVDLSGGELQLELRLRSRTRGGGGVYWTTDCSPRRGEDKFARFAMVHDGQWHDYKVRFTTAGRLTDLRIDPGNAPGEVEFDNIRLVQLNYSPLHIEAVEVDEGAVRIRVRNGREQAVAFSVNGRAYTADGGAAVSIDRPLAIDRPLQAVDLCMELKGFPAYRRTLFVHCPAADADADWVDVERASAATGKEVSPTPPAKSEPRLSARVTGDGSLVYIERGGRLAAFCGPLVVVDGEVPKLEVVRRGPTTRLRGDDITVDLRLEGDVLAVSIDSRRPCEGPAVRVPGTLEQGLFAGLEYLGRGEQSSSKLDIETLDHLRFAPDRLYLTMPLMAVVSNRASVAVSWDDMQLQPVYAAPNFFDRAPDHRMALRGRKIEAHIRVAGGPLEDAILWAVQRRGLPPLPKPPRSREEQWDLCLRGLNGPLRNDEGWGHCVEDRWPRRPYADTASTVWRITGKIPDFPRFVPGGSHIRNESIFFVTGAADEWLGARRREVQAILARQQADGSFRYSGKYRRGHFEDTSSGWCALPAVQLLEYARVTGDRESLEAGLRTLDYMKRFRTPRGAQVWELSLHTPDILASARLVQAYVRGFELTGRRDYLDEARRWALSGLPFVYQWSEKPLMLYATTAVYGATNFRAPLWIGRPVQWCGLVYAYSLALLAPHDDTLDWAHVARGILISGEQQQYSDGKDIGLLPDSIDLATQQRYAYQINPCNLVSLRLQLDGQLDNLSVASDGQHRAVAPFPVTLRDGAVHIQGRADVAYQALVDGRLVDIESEGHDVVPLKRTGG